MPTLRITGWVLAVCSMLAIMGNLLAQRVRNTDAAKANADTPEAPTVAGQVVAYEPGKSLALETRNRNGAKRSEFAVVPDKTRIELPPRIREIKVGMTLAVWADKDDPHLAARIGSPPGMSGNRGNTRNQRPANEPGKPADPSARLENRNLGEALRRPSQIDRTLAAGGLSPSEVARQIDREIEARLAAEKAPIAPVCDDAEFVRRVSLDLSGVIPTADKVAAFLGNTDPDKRAALIDELLASPGYGRYFGELWSQRIVPRDLPTNPAPFVKWLADCFNEGWGWNQIVFELVTAEGSFTPIRLRAPGAAHDPPATFILAACEENQPRPDRLAAASAGLFLGVQIQCAECHDHPFAKWKQTDFWGLAAFFGQLHAEPTDQKPALIWKEFPPAPDHLAAIVIPSTALKSVGATVPARLLGDEEFRPGDQQLLRHSFARWMISPDNPLLARATVNRYWAHFFGRGLVNPVDDLREDNPPSHPAILQLLADELRKSGYDLKHLVRCLCLSQTYQRSSQPLSDSEHDRDLYGQMAVKVISPEVLYDSLTTATGFHDLNFALPGTKAKQGVTMQLAPRDAFVDLFRPQEEGVGATDYSYGVPQALKLLNSWQLNRVAPTAQRLARSGLSPQQAIEQLYLAALARRPTAEETCLMADFLARRNEASSEQGYSAVLWVLINSSEFVLNH